MIAVAFIIDFFLKGDVNVMDFLHEIIEMVGLAWLGAAGYAQKSYCRKFSVPLK